jgi:hypothetical protein
MVIALSAVNDGTNRMHGRHRKHMENPHMSTRNYVGVAGLAMAGVLAACSDAGSPTAASPAPKYGAPNLLVAGSPATSTAVASEFRVCKIGNVSGTFTVVRSDFGSTGFSIVGANYIIAANTCAVVLEDDSPSGQGSNVAVSEVPSTDLVGIAGVTTDLSAVQTPIAAPANGASYFINSIHGVRLTFNNEHVASPPEGCSPGYYKKHDMPGGNLTFAAAGFTNTGTAANVTLKASLDFSGGPTLQDAKNVLLRQAAAAYANSIRLAGYPLSTAQVIAQTNAALATNDRDTILAFAAVLDGYNNLEGPNC